MLGGIFFILVGVLCLSSGLLGVIVLFGIPALIGGWVMISDDLEKKELEAEKKRKENMPPVDITAEEILSNVYRAKSLYEDRQLRVIGKITRISSSRVSLNNDLWCIFASSYLIESVSIGQTVIIKGVFRWNGGSRCYLDNCDDVI